jgi:pyruvate,water dikinase
MGVNDRASTGLAGIDRIIDDLRLGDNVVWQVDSIENYRNIVGHYARQAMLDSRKLIYMRFGRHAPLIDPDSVETCHVEAQRGFESFAAEVYQIVERRGKRAFYIFDCLTDLLESWHSDLMIGNFFKIICPFLYELDTVAYFAIKRNVHTFNTIAGIRETTQLLLDLYRAGGRHYVHPLKVWQRYSPTMFLPHLLDGQQAYTVTSSAEAAELFSRINRMGERPDYWNIMIGKATRALGRGQRQQQGAKRLLSSMLVGKDSRMLELCDRYLTLQDLAGIASRVIGTGFIGGKSVGMLVARKILETDGGERFCDKLEPHDSFYLGSDLFYSYIVQNGWWELRAKQKARPGYSEYAGELRQKILGGRFQPNIKEQFVQMLEYFGQSPIIVRSSSLLEDNFGNAFAGKYDSIFCVNQGTPDERYDAFENAVRAVYASMMNADALEYRRKRGLSGKDEQMAILVQRVSGGYDRDSFYPHVAGVGNSSNLYVWDKDIDMTAGMLRMVFGLGTRAVDRTDGDYARIVCLDHPMRLPPADYADRHKHTQRYADLLSLGKNAPDVRELGAVASGLEDFREWFFRPDYELADRLRELGRENAEAPYVLDFSRIFTETDFAGFMREMLALLSGVYDYPVDIEFTANFAKDGSYRVNLLQCRPLLTRGLGKPVDMPDMTGCRDCFFVSRGNFMGGNVRLPIDYAVYVDGRAYRELREQDRYETARVIGAVNAALKGESVLLAGPGRWGTTTPSLGVPVYFSEISNMAVVCEVASGEAGFMPELSYGSHFFQDLVEQGIFYAAIFDGEDGVVFRPEFVLQRENLLLNLCPNSAGLSGVIHVVRTEGLELFSDIVTQRLVCK